MFFTSMLLTGWILSVGASSSSSSSELVEFEHTIDNNNIPPVSDVF